MKSIDRTDKTHVRCKSPKGAIVNSGKICIFPRRNRFLILKQRHRRSRCIVVQSSLKTDRESYENPLQLRQFVPTLICRTRPICWSLSSIHSCSGTLGLRIILGADIHQLGILKIQIPFATPIFTSTADILLPLKFRNWCFLCHRTSPQIAFKFLIAIHPALLP